MSLKILACRQAYQGSRNGSEFVIYEIEAAKPDGQPINQKLRAFTSLPIGQIVEDTVAPYVSEKYGKSFTLYPKNAKSHNFAEAVNELTQVQSNQQAMIAKLAGRVGELERLVGDLMRGGARTTTAQPQSPNSEALDASFGADV